MYKELEIEVATFQKQLFTGHVKFGIEHGDIITLYITTKLELSNNNTIDIHHEIEKIYPEEKEFYGSVDYNFQFGKIVSSSYSVNLQGEQLKARLRKNQGREVKQCKNVNIAAKM